VNPKTVAGIYNHSPAGSTPTALAARCTACKHALHLAQQLLALPDGASTLAYALQTHCDRSGSFYQTQLCRIQHHQAMTHDDNNYGNDSNNHGGKFHNRKTIYKQKQDYVVTGLYNDVTNVISLMDPAGLDDDLFCHYLMLRSCPLPTELDEQMDLSH
jgi:hypothetical protein